jgi:hypothetical protein
MVIDNNLNHLHSLSRVDKVKMSNWAQVLSQYMKQFPGNLLLVIQEIASKLALVHLMQPVP